MYVGKVDRISPPGTPPCDGSPPGATRSMVPMPKLDGPGGVATTGPPLRPSLATPITPGSCTGMRMQPLPPGGWVMSMPLFPADATIVVPDLSASLTASPTDWIAARSAGSLLQKKSRASAAPVAPLSTAKLAYATSTFCCDTYSNAQAAACGVIGRPGSVTFPMRSCNFGDTPTVPNSLSPAAMSPATCVPWPTLSLHRAPVGSLAGDPVMHETLEAMSIRPANSGWPGSMPESISATRTSGLPPVIVWAWNAPIISRFHCWLERLSGVAGEPGRAVIPAPPADTAASATAAQVAAMKVRAIRPGCRN